MEEALIACLLAANTAAQDRVTWRKRPQGSDLPAIVLHRKGGRDDVTYSGRSGLVDSRVQVDCWADNDTAARLLAKQARAALAAYRTAPVQGVFVLSQSDPADEDGSNGQTPDTNLSRSRLDLRVRHIEP